MFILVKLWPYPDNFKSKYIEFNSIRYCIDGNIIFLRVSKQCSYDKFNNIYICVNNKIINDGVFYKFVRKDKFLVK